MSAFSTSDIVGLVKAGADFIASVVKRAKNPEQAIRYIEDRTRELDEWEGELDEKIRGDFPSREEPES